MLSISGSIFFYLFLLFFTVILLSYYERHPKYNKLLYLVYFVLTLFSVIRYDIGNDYSEHFEIAKWSINMMTKNNSIIWIANDLDIEVSFVFLAWLFKWSNFPFFYINAFYSICTWSLLFFICKRYNCHKWGVVIYIICGYLFNNWDWIRQSLSMMIIIYGYQFVNGKNFLKYFLCVSCATFIHNSAFLMLPCYFLKYFKAGNRFYIIAVVVLLLAYWSNALLFVKERIISLFLNFEEYEAYGNLTGTANIGNFDTIAYKIRVTFIIFLWTFVICNLKNLNFLRNCLLIGLYLFTISLGSLVLSRIGYYFLEFGIIAFPISLVSTSYLKKKRIFYGFAIIMFLFFCYDIVNLRVRGCMPYETVFSESFERGIFRQSDF